MGWAAGVLYRCTPVKRSLPFCTYMESTHDRWIAIESFYLSIYYVFIIINDERLYDNKS